MVYQRSKRVRAVRNWNPWPTLQEIKSSRQKDGTFPPLQLVVWGVFTPRLPLGWEYRLAALHRQVTLEEVASLIQERCAIVNVDPDLPVQLALEAALVRQQTKNRC